MPLQDPLKRDFYAHMCQLENWSVRQLRERINSMLFERTAIAKKPAVGPRLPFPQNRDNSTTHKTPA
jgi:predicted nuclease of restriction endonuclease-like (RecB) superfamily